MGRPCRRMIHIYNYFWYPTSTYVLLHRDFPVIFKEHIFMSFIKKSFCQASAALEQPAALPFLWTDFFQRRVIGPRGKAQ